ncbi:trafficking kinesin-binding protein milt [Halyomorpha halys]|uniref:trafficking kinesin-binding protein milt n=1 Tax=Halyomorpha halys TaxID=286706 RepID=UPI0006D517F2|nr:trafficking kinesin-binding protein milt-like [Halyomorpha halys]
MVSLQEVNGYSANLISKMYLPDCCMYCSERMRQMNRTYDDIEAVRRLLSEKEHELELVTRIGQNLLSEKTKLQSDIGTLKDDLCTANEKITQLSHELTQKTELINNLLSDVDEVRSEGGSPGFTSQFQLSFLERKIKTLEEENAGLHNEAARLTQENENCEETEARLVGELTQELNCGREELEIAALENAKLREERNQMKEVIDHLEARVQTADEKLTQAVKENEEYIQIINIMRETQGELTAELADCKERYNEVQRFLEEYREEERRSKKKMSPKVRVGPGYCTQLTSVWPPLSRENPESIGAELSASLLSELSLDSGLGASTLDLESHTPVNRLGAGPGFVVGQQRDLELEKALESVTRRDIEERRNSLFWDTAGGCSTPDSFLSQSGYNMPSVKLDKVQLVKPLEGSETLRQWSQLATPSMHGLLEDRPGVKVRGGTELEDLGIQKEKKDKKVVASADATETYSLSDVEEDEELNPGKSFSDTNHIYTFVNSRIMHPKENIAHCTTSSSSSQMVWSAPGLSGSLACTPSVPPTPTPANSPSMTPMSTPASTPANSPINSPSERPSSPVSSSALTTALFNPYSYLSIIKKTIGSALSPSVPPPKALARPDNKAALRGFRLVERIEQQIGLEEILCREPESGLHRASLLRRGVRSLARGELLGVPGRPGTGVLDNRLKQLKRRPRTDLGSVQPQQSVSSFVFGRKGGLL